MQEETVVAISELTKLFVVCPNQGCGAEIGFDLAQRQYIIQPLICPVCHETLLTVNGEQRFEFTWVTLVKKLVEEREGKPQMFFRLDRVVHQPNANDGN